MKRFRYLWLCSFAAMVGCGGAPSVEPTAPEFDEKLTPQGQQQQQHPPQNPNAPKYMIGMGPSRETYRG